MPWGDDAPPMPCPAYPVMIGNVREGGGRVDRPLPCAGTNRIRFEGYHLSSDAVGAPLADRWKRAGAIWGNRGGNANRALRCVRRSFQDSGRTSLRMGRGWWSVSAMETIRGEGSSSPAFESSAVRFVVDLLVRRCTTRGHRRCGACRCESRYCSVIDNCLATSEKAKYSFPPWFCDT